MIQVHIFVSFIMVLNPRIDFIFQVPSKHNALLVFAPVVPDGYGICYNPMPDNINVCVSAWNSSPETDSKRMMESVRQAFMEGQEVLVRGSAKAKL